MAEFEEERIIKNFYTYCLTTCSQRRLKKIQYIINNSRKIINKDLDKLNVEDVVKFLSYINQSKFKAWTKNDYKKIFKRFLKWHYKDLEMFAGDKVKLGFRGVSSLKAFNKEKINKDTLVTPNELEKLLRTAKSLKWKALISIMYESAFRPCEIRQLKWENLKFEDSSGLCRCRTLSPKTKEQRIIPVKDCVVHLKRWREEYQFDNRTDKDFVFPSQHDRNKPMGDGVITQMFKRICKDAKIRPIFPYLLRHSRIYEIQKKLDTRLSSKFAGHSIETSKIYEHLDDDDVEESMLKEIYTTQEISPSQKVELEKEIIDIKLRYEELTQKINEQLDNGNSNLYALPNNKKLNALIEKGFDVDKFVKDILNRLIKENEA